MDSNHQVIIVRGVGGGVHPTPTRVMDMEFENKVMYDAQPAVEDMTATDDSMSDVIRVKEKDQVYTQEALGITGKQAIQMPDEVFQDMEVEDNCIGMKATDQEEPVVDLASLRGFKAGGDDLQWRGRRKVEEAMQSPEADNAMFLYNDDIIDMKVARKKVIPPEARDESNKPVEMPEVRHKVPPRLKIAQKRPLLSSNDEDKGTPASPRVWMETETAHRFLKAATSLIKDMENKTAKPQGINFNPEMFSGFDQLEDKGFIGQGAYGKIVKVKDVKKGHTMIVKKVKSLEQNEVLIPLQFPHQDSLARIFGFCWDGEDAQLVQEDAGISLRQLISTKEAKTLEETGRPEKIVLDIFKGISILASHGITHCDIKPENVCLNLETMRAKLIDLGSSRTPQDAMTYKGITPEYLPPAPNKFCYQYLVCGNRSVQAPRLGEKDDVWAGAMVGLFLMMRAHPMIKWVTTFPDYLGHMSDEEKERLRNKVMEKISQLCDEPSPFPNEQKEIPVKDAVRQMLKTRSYTKKLPIMEDLLDRVLVVDENKRWTSAEVTKFLQKRLDMVTQPPLKAFKRCGPAQVDDIEIGDVDLKVAKNESQQPQQHQLFRQVSASPNQDQCSALGVAFKPAATQMRADIPTPAQFNFQPPRQITPAPAIVGSKCIVAPQPTTTGAQTIMMRQAQSRRVSLWDCGSEASEYESLVESFNVSAKVTPGPVQQVSRHAPMTSQPKAAGFYAQSAAPTQQSPTSGHQDMGVSKRYVQTAAGFHVQSAGFTQRRLTSGYQDMDISRRRVQSRPQSSSTYEYDDPSANSSVAITGLFEGNTVVFRDGREVGVVEQQSEGNLPNMDALMSTSFGEGEDLSRPKLKGRRRNGPNN